MAAKVLAFAVSAAWRIESRGSGPSPSGADNLCGRRWMLAREGRQGRQARGKHACLRA